MGCCCCYPKATSHHPSSDRYEGLYDNLLNLSYERRVENLPTISVIFRNIIDYCKKTSIESSGHYETVTFDCVNNIHYGGRATSSVSS